MDAGRDQTEGGASTAVGVGLRVYIGARIQEEAGDLDDVRRGLLPKVFDAVGGDVMQQSGMVFPGGALAHEPRVSREQPPKGRCIAADNGVGRRFECVDRGVGARQFPDVYGRISASWQTRVPGR